MSATKSESLLRMPNENFGVLQPFLPDTPWTTMMFHVLQQRCGEAYVDSPESPRNIVVTATGDGTPECPDLAYLFGMPSADGIQEYVAGVKRHTEFVCDKEMYPVIEQHHPANRACKTVVAWYDYLDVEMDYPHQPGLRRLRSSDAALAQRILPPRDFRTFADAKALIMAGGAYGAFDGDDLVSVAYTPDHSVKFERVAVYTHQAHRRKGLGFAAAAKLLNNSATRGRIPCALIPEDRGAGWALAQKLGFPRTALVESYRTS